MTVYHKLCGGGPVIMDIQVTEQYIVDGVDTGGPFHKAGASPIEKDIDEVYYYCKQCGEQLDEEDMWDSDDLGDSLEDLCNCGFPDDEHGNGFECPRRISEDPIEEDK